MARTRLIEGKIYKTMILNEEEEYFKAQLIEYLDDGSVPFEPDEIKGDLDD